MTDFPGGTMSGPALLLVLGLGLVVVSAEESLSWTSFDPEVRDKMLALDSLAEGQEEDRVLPWVVFGAETKNVSLKCIMRGYNASYAASPRWEHPDLPASHVRYDNTAVEVGEEEGSQYARWTVAVLVTAAEVGDKKITCNYQQGNFVRNPVLEVQTYTQAVTDTACRENSCDAGTATLAFSQGEDTAEPGPQVAEEVRRQVRERYGLGDTAVAGPRGNVFTATVAAKQVGVCGCPPPPRPATSSGLGGGAIFGIVLAVLICLGVLAFGGHWGYKRIQAEAEGDNPI